MVSIDDLNDAYKRINPYIVKTPIHISEALNKKFDSNIFYYFSLSFERYFNFPIQQFLNEF